MIPVIISVVDVVIAELTVVVVVVVVVVDVAAHVVKDCFRKGKTALHLPLS